MYVTVRRGPLVFAAFLPSTSVLGINSLQFSFPNVICYHLYPPLLWSANLFSKNKIFSCHDWCFIFTYSFHMPIPPQLLASHNLHSIFNPSYFLNTIISDLILQSFSKNHLEHSDFTCFQPIDILDCHSPAFSAINTLHCLHRFSTQNTRHLPELLPSNSNSKYN